MKKKCMAACLSLLLILGAVPLSTGNALGNFTDIADSATAGNVEILQMMEVIYFARDVAAMNVRDIWMNIINIDVRFVVKNIMILNRKCALVQSMGWGV